MAPEGSKRHRIIEAAIAVFLEHGYAATSVDRIQQRAGGSKATIYRYFHGKAELFAAIIETLVAQMTAPIDRQPLTPDGTTEELASTLARFGRAYLDVLLETRSLALYRMVMAESGRFPELGKLFYTRGPGPVAAQLTEYLRSHHPPADCAPDVQAREFLSLARADLHLKALLGVDIAGPAERDRTVSRAIAVFLAQPRRNHCR